MAKKNPAAKPPQTSILAWLKNEVFLIAAIVVLSAGTHFYSFNFPNQIVFDELHFANFITNHLAGTYYFDIHPPLAKIILAESANLFGLAPDLGFEYEKIGKEYSHPEFYQFIRLIVTFFGFLLPLCLYFLARELFHDKWIAFIAGFLAVFENALLVHSRYILTDIFLLTFGLLGLAFLLMHLRRSTEKRKHSWWPLILSGLFLGGALSVKWTGLVFPGLAGLIVLYYFFRSFDVSRFCIRAGVLLATVAMVYIASFAWHLNSLDKSGPGDAFMTPEFRATLTGTAEANNPSVEPKTFWPKFTELNKQMYTSNKGITSEHAYGSKWYSWPFMSRTVYYWNERVNADDAENLDEHRIYLLGNPAIWWVGALIMFFLTFHVLAYLYVGKTVEYLIPLAIILIGFWANLLPYAPIDRVSFVYHYFPSLLFVMIAIAYVFRRLLWKDELRYITVFYLAIVMLTYAYFSPLTYGVALSPEAFDARMWLPGWR